MSTLKEKITEYKDNRVCDLSRELEDVGLAHSWLIDGLGWDFELPPYAMVGSISPLTIYVSQAEDSLEVGVLLHSLSRLYKHHFDREVLDGLNAPMIRYSIVRYGEVLVKVIPSIGSSCKLVPEEHVVTRYRLECE